MILFVFTSTLALIKWFVLLKSDLPKVEMKEKSNEIPIKMKK
ncbi:hypothetical protein JGI1_00609 [Candidatus Thermokryptus mobilis]|uniref:Uncharacterized protein n=1 Tax=Candidatus Thermokryptus mobilis TaxID=1643428 RepID=A0A0S4MV88_9BACT|nr:hypothetical protein JGI1_00609 [Candidatus Thermokryptus mobilis]